LEVCVTVSLTKIWGTNWSIDGLNTDEDWLNISARNNDRPNSSDHPSTQTI